MTSKKKKQKTLREEIQEDILSKKIERELLKEKERIDERLQEIETGELLFEFEFGNLECQIDAMDLHNFAIHLTSTNIPSKTEIKKVCEFLMKEFG